MDQTATRCYQNPLSGLSLTPTSHSVVVLKAVQLLGGWRVMGWQQTGSERLSQESWKLALLVSCLEKAGGMKEGMSGDAESCVARSRGETVRSSHGYRGL
jgi:hypothetical protein